MDNPVFPDHIRYNYVTEAGTRLRPAHGVWGGINPHGEVEMCFYDESDIPPEVTEQAIAPDGTPGTERLVEQESARQIRRNIHTRILLNYHTARAVLEWLQDRVDELDAEGNGDIFDLGGGLQQ